MTDPREHPPLDPAMLGREAYILEGLVTTTGADGGVHVAPMGPIVTDAMDWLWLRPFRDTATFKNLDRSACGVFHVTDDVELIARAAVAPLTPTPATTPTTDGRGMILTDACRWYAFEVEWIDATTERTSALARVVQRGVLRDFVGFNRAKHAVLEAAILATRLHLFAPGEIESELARLAAPIEKTGGAAEHRAFQFLREYVEQGRRR